MSSTPQNLKGVLESSLSAPRWAERGQLWELHPQRERFQPAGAAGAREGAARGEGCG